MKKTALVTGANRGIGLEFCRQLQNDYKVVAACRQTSPDLNQLSVEVIEGIDVSQDSVVGRLRDAVQVEQIDLLINNAGIMRRTGFPEFDYQAMRDQFEVNALGPLRVAQALAPLMPAGGKMVLITSLMGSIGDNSSGGSYGYRMSKTALNSAGKCLAFDLQKQGVAVAILHPGYVKTDMTGHTGRLTVEQSVTGLLKRIHSFELSETGSFWHTSGEPLPW